MGVASVVWLAGSGYGWWEWVESMGVVNRRWVWDCGWNLWV